MARIGLARYTCLLLAVRIVSFVVWRAIFRDGLLLVPVESRSETLFPALCLEPREQYRSLLDTGVAVRGVGVHRKWNPTRSRPARSGPNPRSATRPTLAATTPGQARPGRSETIYPRGVLGTVGPHLHVFVRLSVCGAVRSASPVASLAEILRLLLPPATLPGGERAAEPTGGALGAARGLTVLAH